MALPRTAWGIDIGNRALKGVKLSRTAEGVAVDDVVLIEHETPLSQAGDNRESLTSQALGRFVEMKDVKKTALAVGVSGGQSLAKFVKLPPVDAKQVPQIVQFEAQQQIPFPTDEVEWTYQLFQRPDDPELEVGIFAMRKELVNRHVANFTDLDLNVELVQTTPLADYNGVQHDGRLSKGSAMILNMGAESTDLIIGDDHTLWTSSVRIGGDTFTEAIQEAFKVDFKKAEKLKRESRSSKYSRQIFQAMRPVFADLVSEIQRRTGAFTSTHPDVKIRKVIPMGGGFKLPMLAKYLQQNLGMPVDKPDRFLAEPPAAEDTQKLWDENLLAMGSAYGLAVQALGGGAITSSLLPEHIRQERIWKDKTKWFAAAAALVVAGTALAYGRYFLDSVAYASGEVDRGEVARIESQANDLDGRWRDVEDAGGTEIRTIDNVFSLMNYSDLWPQITADLLAAMPAPQPDVARGLATGDAELIKSVPRDQREVVQIESWDSEYRSDLTSLLEATDFVEAVRGGATGNVRRATGGGGGGFGAGEDEAAGASEGQRGFLMTLNLVTPRRDAARWVDEAVKAKLEEIGPDADNPNLRYRVARVGVVRSQRFADDTQRLQRLEADYADAKRAEENPGDVTGGRTTGTGRPAPGAGRGPGGGFNPYDPTQGGFPGEFGPGGPGAGFNPYDPGAAGPPRNAGRNNNRDRGRRGGRNDDGDIYGDEQQASYNDRLTGESLLEDSAVELVVAIVVDPPAYSPDAPAEGEGGEEGADAVNDAAQGQPAGNPFGGPAGGPPPGF